MLFERNVAGVFRTTLDGRILDCNDALVSYLGYSSREELLAHETWDLYQQRGDREQFISQLQSGHALTNLRLKLKKKDGTSITGVVNATMIPGEGEEWQVLGTMVEES
jgi:PAS domain S-box-containing protein